MARSFPPFLYCSIPDQDKQLYCLSALHSKLSLYSITSQLQVLHHTSYASLFKHWAYYCIFGNISWKWQHHFAQENPLILYPLPYCIENTHCLGNWHMGYNSTNTNIFPSNNELAHGSNLQVWPWPRDLFVFIQTRYRIGHHTMTKRPL